MSQSTNSWYWIELSKRPTLTDTDFRSFLRKAEETLEHFREFYGPLGRRDKFLRVVPVWISAPKLYFDVYETHQLTDNDYAVIKDIASKFVPRIKKCFGQQLALSHAQRTPLQDAEILISSSTKLTYRWAAGIIASNYIATLLIRLSNFKRNEKFHDDIKTLYSNLKTRTTNANLRRFLEKNYRRFEDADKTRNRCAHVNEGEPTRQEIEQSISLGRLLQRFV